MPIAIDVCASLCSLVAIMRVYIIEYQYLVTIMALIYTKLHLRNAFGYIYKMMVVS